jgi:glucosamine-6-phosphate deaminase
MDIERDIFYGEEALKVYKPEIVIGSEGDVDKYSWLVMENQIRMKPASVVTLATGSSPLGMYRLWIEAFKKGLVSRSVITKNLDEYVGIPGHPQSYYRYMRENLFDYIDIPEAQCFIPDTGNPDPYEEAEKYGLIVRELGISDLSIIGIGPGMTCHVAFNERGSTLNSRTRVIRIEDETIRANSRFFEEESQVPRFAITQGIADILESRKIILIAKGYGKAEGVKRTLEGEIGPDAPASFLRLHPNVTFVLDYEAAKLLSK